MQKGIKAGILIVALAVPALIFLFLSFKFNSETTVCTSGNSGINYMTIDCKCSIFKECKILIQNKIQKKTL